MALLDVDDILADPDIAGDTIVIQRINRTVDPSTGMTVDTPYTITTYGNAQPASGRQINSLPEAQRVADMMTFYVPVSMQALTTTQGGDIVLWNNEHYRIISSRPFNNYGSGFYIGIGSMIEMAPEAPIDS